MRVLNGKRDDFKSYLTDLGIPTMIYYPIHISEQQAYKGFPRVSSGLPNSKSLTNSSLSLPMHPYLSEREVDAVIVLSNKSNLKASELAKELGTTRLDAYNSLERLQTIGLVTVTADRPMRFSSPPINEAVRHLIGIRKDQLLRIEQGFEELQKGIN